MDPNELERLKIQTLQTAISSNDELLHYSIYQWFLDCHLSDELLQIKSPFLEKFLKNNKDQQDLLWQFYLRNEKYAEAAAILTQLADKKDPAVIVPQRIEHLSRAKSCLARTGQTDGQQQHILQEKIEV